jgi:hypothetical protein
MHILAPSPKCSWRYQSDTFKKVRDDDGVIASTRGRVRSPERPCANATVIVDLVELHARLALSLINVTRF